MKQPPYPAHESLQEFAERIGRSVRDAYPLWHNKEYKPIKGWYANHYGPGIALYPHWL